MEANNSFIFSNPKVCSFSQKNGLTFDDSGDKIVVKCIACRGSRFRKKISLAVVTRGFNGSVNIPESCDFRSQFDPLNIIC